MVVLGGLGSIRGVVVAAVLLSVLNNYLLPDVFYDLPARFGLDFDLSAISSGIYGVIIVVVMLLFPEGLAPTRRTLGRGSPCRGSDLRVAAGWRGRSGEVPGVSTLVPRPQANSAAMAPS